MKETTKTKINEQLKGYLENKGINTRKNFRCLSGTHEDNNPSMSYDPNRNKVHCFSCNADYDLLELVKVEYGISEFSKVLEKASEITGIYDDYVTIPNPTGKKVIEVKEVEKIDQSDYFRRCIARVNETDYLKNRGFTEEAIQKFNLGYDPNFKHSTGGKTWEVIIIPTSKYSYVARNINSSSSSDKVRKFGQSTPLNLRHLKGDEPVFIVEGELDAISIEQLGYKAIGLGGAANYNKLYQAIEQVGVEQLPPFILALDNDDAGKEAEKRISQELDRREVKYIQAGIYDENYKDANDMLVNSHDIFIHALEDTYNSLEAQIKAEELKEVEEYRKNSTYYHIQDFIDGVNSSVNTSYIPTGFHALDHFLDGGLYEGLYIMGAITSLGKTTFALQIVDQVAQSGHDVLIFSLEMARHELMAKSISRETFIKGNEDNLDPSLFKTTRGITTGSRYKLYSEAEKGLINDAISRYSEYANNIFIHEGIGDIGVTQIAETVKKHIKITGKKPLVFIDYLQILAPYDVRTSDKQNTDKAVLELKRLSRELKIPVLAISSFNRENYGKPLSLSAFKESGAIEYGSDVLLGIQLRGVRGKDGKKNNEFNEEEAIKKDPREVEVLVMKNRNGEKGTRVFMNFYPKFNYYEELRGNQA